MHTFRICWLALMLLGCEDGRIATPFAQPAAAPQLKSLGAALLERRITIEAAAGRWRAVLLPIDEALWAGEDAFALGLAVEPDAGAMPYLAMGLYVRPADFDGVPLLSFHSFPGDRPDATALEVRRGNGGNSNAIRADLALVFGSNGGPAQLHVGRLQAEDPRDGTELVQLLAARARAPYRHAEGVGGWAGSHLRLLQADGSVREQTSGELHAERGSPAPEMAGFSALDTLRLSGQAQLATAGWAGIAFFARPELALQDWSVDVALPPHRHAAAGLWASAGDAQPPITASLLGLEPPALFMQLANAEGPASLLIERTLSGREGPSTAAVTAGLSASWGWVSTDFAALYGWPMREILPAATDE